MGSFEVCEYCSRGPAEHELAEPVVPEGAHHEQACVVRLRRLLQAPADGKTSAWDVYMFRFDALPPGRAEQFEPYQIGPTQRLYSLMATGGEA